MRVLTDREGAAGAEDLARAWESPETFAFLPQKSGHREAWSVEALGQLPAALAEGHFALLSSGSTGEPRLVVGARTRSEALARLLHAAQDSEPVRSTVGLLPLTYSYSFVNQWLWARVNGRVFLPTEGLSRPETAAAALEEAEASMVCLVAAHVPLFASQLPGRSFPRVLRVHFAGGRFPQERLGEIRGVFPKAGIFNNYGCVEAMPRLCLRRAEDGESAADVGRPLPGVELSSDAGGRLSFRSPYGAVAVVDASGFHAIGPEEWVPTGDLAHRGDSGHWHLDGRSGEVFKRYGERISLSALSDAVRSVWPAEAVFYRATDSLGEAGHVLVLAPHPSAEELRAILARLRRDYSRSHWPLRIESAEALPLLPNGKPDVAALPGFRVKLVQWNQRV